MKIGGSLPHSKVPATWPFLSQLDPVHNPTSHYLKFHLNIILPLRLGPPSGLFHPRFPTKILYTSFPSPTRSTCLSHLILVDLITRKILDEQCRSLSSSLSRLATPLLVASFVHYRRAANQMTTYPRPLVATLAPTFAPYPTPGPPNSVSADEVTCIHTNYRNVDTWPWKFPLWQSPITRTCMSVEPR